MELHTVDEKNRLEVCSKHYHTESYSRQYLQAKIFDEVSRFKLFSVIDSYMVVLTVDDRNSFDSSV